MNYLHPFLKGSDAMNFLKLLWSFMRHADQWLYLLSNYDHIWIPEQDEPALKSKHRTMWGD